jgi:hypothetical protein
MKSHYKKHLLRRAKINSLNTCNVKYTSDLTDSCNTLLTTDKRDKNLSGIENLPTQSHSPVLYTKNLNENFPQITSRNLFHINFLGNDESDQASHLVPNESYEYLDNNLTQFNNNNYYLSNNNLMFLGEHDGNIYNNLYSENLGYFKY